MRLCHETEADIFVDNRPYRLETEAEYRHLMHMAQLKGIRWVDMQETQRRLEEARQRKARQLRRDPIAPLFGRPLSLYSRLNRYKEKVAS